MNVPPRPPPKPSRPDLDDELREYLREQRGLDLKGRLEALHTNMDRFYDLFLKHDAEDKARHQELRGDMRGLSLRVGEVERKVERHDERLDTIEGRTEKHERELDDSKTWIVTTLDGKAKKAEEKATWLRRNAIPLAAAIIALVSAVWHLFR